MEKTEITEKFVEDAQLIPKEDRSFLLGYLNGVTARVNMEQERNDRRTDIQKAN